MRATRMNTGDFSFLKSMMQSHHESLRTEIAERHLALRFLSRKKNLQVKCEIECAGGCGLSFQHAQNCAAERIVPAMRDHSGTQAFPPPRQQTEHQSEDRNQEHACRALVSVRGAEDNRRKNDADGGRFAHLGELPLQVSA